jgi:CheY-like chemotaxis protein
MNGDDLPPMLRGKSVLIVEDQYLVADGILRAVETLGGRVIGPVRDCQSALQLAAEEKPDLALLDINLDGVEVYPAAKELRRMRIPMIFTTGYDRSAIAAEFTETPHLDKPVTAWGLAAALSKISHARR